MSTKIRRMTVTGLAAAMLCMLGPLTVALPMSPVPISMLTVGLYLSTYLLDRKTATVTCLLYLLIGAVGLPVFSGFSGGMGKILGPTGGYLIGYLLITWIGGSFSSRKIPGLLLGTGLCYLLGSSWLAWQTGLTFEAALLTGVVPFLPGDGIKFVIVAVLGPKLRQSLQRAGIKSLAEWTK